MKSLKEMLQEAKTANMRQQLKDEREEAKAKKLSESKDIDLDKPFYVISLGGSIGRSDKNTFGSGNKMGTVVDTFDDQGEAKKDAARRRKGLSAGEKSYYKMSYSAVKGNKSKVQNISEAKKFKVGALVLNKADNTMKGNTGKVTKIDGDAYTVKFGKHGTYEINVKDLEPSSKMNAKSFDAPGRKHFKESQGDKHFDKAFEEIKKYIKTKIPSKWTRRMKYTDETYGDKQVIGVYFNVDMRDLDDDIGEDFSWELQDIGEKHGIEIEVARDVSGPGIKWIK